MAQKPLFIACALFLLTLQIRAKEFETTRLLRFPDAYGDQVAFVYGGDIWLAPINGGTARQLTSHEGLELFPKFSPDGRWLAFSAEYSGSRQVHIMPAHGGVPQQLTYYNDVGPLPPRGGFDHQVLGWTPDSKAVLFRANRLPWGVRMGRYYTVPIDGGLETPLPVPEGGTGMLTDDSHTLVYTPIAREFRTWKRHRGGRAQDVWTYDLLDNTSKQLTDFVGTDNQPQWFNNKIYFTSDREHTLNLFVINPDGSDLRQVTHHTDYDVLWPSAGTEGIVYECGGSIYHYNPTTDSTRQIPLRVQSDRHLTLPEFKSVQSQINWFELSPGGKRALFEARGDLLTVPAEKGEIRNLTKSPEVREIYPTWSPDGKWIAYLSDRSGEYEIYLIAADGRGRERRLTTNGSVWRFAARWSPDASHLAFADKSHRLYVVRLSDGKIVTVDESHFGEFESYSWSPDGKWLVYDKRGENRFLSLWGYSLTKGQSQRLTSDDTDDFSPVFDPEGRYLYFLSNRNFNLTFSGWEFNYLYTQPTRVYIATLNSSLPSPFAPESDEEPKKKNDDKETKSSAKSNTLIELQTEGFEERILALPVPAGSYHSLNAHKNGVLYLRNDKNGDALYRFDLEKRKEESVLEGVSGYVLSYDGEKVLFNKNKSYGIVDAQPGQTGGRLLDLERMAMQIDPRAEWRQMFVDGWRLLRDWFYDENMHGVDWQAMRRRYEPLVEHLAHRTDLDYIFGELGGELVAGHVYVNPGDQPAIERIDGGLLGAELVDHPSGYYRIAKIFRGENWHQELRSPLTEPGVRVEEGDFILAIEGTPLRTDDNPYRLLQNTAGRAVTLLINDKPDTKGAHEEVVRPIKRETDLRYLDWVRSRRALVDSLSGGRIGYIHLPNTAADGNRELFKHFYPQAQKEALIIDVRYNGGGFIPDRMIELLDRPILNYWVRRNTEPYSTPVFSHAGPKACLINGYSSSGGDAFPYYFRKRGLGKLIGTRTWGGLIGLSGNPALMDGGSFSIPTFRFLGTDGVWEVENEGVAPDIQVIDRPEEIAAGRDPSIQKAVEILLQELKEQTTGKISAPPPPDESSMRN
ncbi:PD40 domain-containing protein [candidate division KSB1 bacterium]|nr:PD40 domain-containing protein [candidate division KSB1 bacterium]